MIHHVAWAYQSSYLSLNEIDKTQEALDEIGALYTEFGLVPFSDEIRFSEHFPTLKDSDIPVIALGSTKLIKLWSQSKLPRNWFVYWNQERFDHRMQVGMIDDGMLNADAEEHSLPDAINLSFPTDRFIRPVNDLKLFNGQVLPKATTFHEHIETQTVDSEIYTTKEVFLSASVKQIVREYRCFVVDWRVVDLCLYKEDGRIVANDRVLTGPHRIAIENAALQFKPSTVYVVDIAELPDGQHKVIEYNCFNASGYYFCNRAKIFRAIEKSLER